MTLSDQVAGWFHSHRGITRETLEQFRVTTEGDTVVIPYTESTAKHRQGIPHGERKFWFTKGFKPSLFNASAARRKHVFLCEGETDTMRLWQELGEQDGVGVVGLSGINTWHEGLADSFKDAEKVWVLLDNDQDYNVVGQVDTVWRSIRQTLGPKAQRIRLPKDVKDVCEFFTLYDLDELREKVKTPAASLHYQALDLTREPPPIEWLIEGQVAKGDVTVLLGESNVGKSWITLSLALAVAEGWDTWLGLPVNIHGPVLYVDEENPHDVVYDRLHQLGMTEKGKRNIRYLHEQGVRLDRDPDKLLDDALALSPKLIVLDSLSRIHTQDENNAGSMAALYNNGVKPLARQTGATVMLLHHTGKTDSSSSYQRSRGSGDITASADAGLDVRAADSEGHITIATYKSRRRSKKGNVLHAVIHDTPQGGVELRRITEPEPPF